MTAYLPTKTLTISAKHGDVLGWVVPDASFDPDLPVAAVFWETAAVPAPAAAFARTGARAERQVAADAYGEVFRFASFDAAVAALTAGYDATARDILG